MQFVEFLVTRPSTGAVIPHAKVTVYVTGTTTLAALFDASDTSIGNPVTAGTNGLVGFAAANGAYDFAMTSADGTLALPVIHRQQFYDLSGLDAQVAAVEAAQADVDGKVSGFDAHVAAATTTSMQTIAGAGASAITAIAALVPIAPRYDPQALLQMSGGVTQAYCPADYHLAEPKILDTFFAAAISGTGTASVSILLDRVAVYGPVTLNSAYPRIDTISILIPQGADLGFAVESASGITGLLLKAEGQRA